MLRVMRKYQKGVLGIIAILFICFAMAGFGLDIFLSQSERQAITVNDKTVSYTDFYQQVRETRERYVQMFGAQFAELAKSFNLNIPQQVVDQSINGLLVEETAEQIGLAVGQEELRSFISKSFEGDNSRYSNFLRTSGYTAMQFEERMKKDLLREQFASLINLTSFVSRKEAEAILRKDETEIEIQYVQITPESVRSRVAEPSDEVMKLYFENNVSDFQTEAQVAYQYLVFAPEQFAKDVIIGEEDIAFYLSENEAQFSLPARAKISHIEILFPKDSSTKQQEETKARAEAIVKRAREGEAFAELVLEASDDITTKMLGGELGWIDSQSTEKDLVSKVFSLETAGVADLVETSSGYRVVKVEELEPSKVKDFSEVRSEIEATLRAQEAPSYAAAKTLELFEELKAGKISLADLGVRYQMPVQKTAGLISGDKDPVVDLKNLTTLILEEGEQKLHRIEIGNRVVLALVDEYKEPTIPAFDIVKSQIVEIIKGNEAKNKAESVAKEFATKLTANDADMVAIAAEYGVTVATKDKITKKIPLTEPLTDPQLTEELFQAPEAGEVLQGVFKSDNGSLVVRIAKVTRPAADEIEKKIDGYRDQAGSAVASTMTTSILNQLKASGKVDFDQSILGG